jgi:hypothetical protein
MRVLSKKSVTAATAALVLVGGGAAFAYWTTTGSGTGTATAGDVTALTVKQTSSVAGLYPGGPALTLSGNFDNPNSGKVFVASVSATVTGTDHAGCTAADFEIGGSAPVGTEINPGTGVGSWTGLTLRLVDSSANQDACKGATVALAYTAS